MVRVEDWEGNGQVIADEDDIDPGLNNTIADSVAFGGGAGGQLAKFDDAQPTLGGSFSARLFVNAGNFTSNIFFDFLATDQPTLITTFRSAAIGVIAGSGGTLSQGPIPHYVRGLGGSGNVLRVQFAEGAIQFLSTSSPNWHFLKSDGTLSLNSADADKTRWVIDTNYKVEISWVTNSTYDLKLDDVVQNSSPISTIGATQPGQTLISNHRLNANVWYGDTTVPDNVTGPSYVHLIAQEHTAGLGLISEGY